MDHAPSSPELLARLAATRSPEAWAMLVARHGAELHRAARAVAGPHLADDAVQEALIAVARHAHCFRLRDPDADAAVGRWLGRIAANCAANLVRGARRRQRHEMFVPTPVELCDTDEDPRLAPLRCCLAELPEAQRRLILLRHVHELGDAELAQVLACTPGAARVRLHRAMEALRQRLARIGCAVALALLTDLLHRATAAEPIAPPVWPLPPSDLHPFLSPHHLFGGPAIMKPLVCLGAVATLSCIAVLAWPVAAEETMTTSLPPANVAPVLAAGVQAAPAALPAAKALDAFTWQLWAQLPAQGNAFASPWSVRTCLGMLRLGAEGQTAAELDAVLAPQGAAEPALLAALVPPLIPDWAAQKQVPAYVLHSANALWGQAGHPFVAEFLLDCQAQYGAGLGQVDFRTATEAARTTINAWVGEQTRTRIPELIPTGSLDCETRLVLTNAVYFKAAWARDYDFHHGATRQADFHAAAGTTRCMLMRQTKGLLHHTSDGMDLVVLPYFGGSMELVLVVPRAHDGLAAVEAGLAAGQFRAWRAAAAQQRVELHLPRFTFRSPANLNAALQALGIGRAFSQKSAEFALIDGGGSEPLYVSQVIHEGWVAVDEEGTEAAAATAIVARPGGGIASPQNPPIPVHCDRPFVFVIRHVATGAPLFVGRVADPGMH